LTRRTRPLASPTQSRYTELVAATNLPYLRAHLLLPDAVTIRAQGVTPESLAAAQTVAEKTEKDWFSAAQGLDAKLAPLLPCDANARRLIQDVSRASETRIAALMAYYRLAAAQAADQTQAARKLLEAEEARGIEAADERTEASLERAALEQQGNNLSAAAFGRPALGDARKSLTKIEELAAKRSTFAEQSAAGRERGLKSLRDLAAAYQTRETALKQEIDAFQSEATRWNTYYSLRLSRAQAECAAIGGGTSAPATPKRSTKGKKQ